MELIGSLQPPLLIFGCFSCVSDIRIACSSVPWDCCFPLLFTLILCLKNSNALLRAQVCFIPFRKSLPTQLPPPGSLPVRCDADTVTSPGNTPTQDEPHCSPTPCVAREKSHHGPDGCLHKLLFTYLKRPAGLPRNVHVSLGSALLTVCDDSSLHSPLYSNFFLPKLSYKWPCLVLHGRKNHQVAGPPDSLHEICMLLCTDTCVLLTSCYKGGKEPYFRGRATPMCGQHLISSHIWDFEPSFLGSSHGHLDVLLPWGVS